MSDNYRTALFRDNAPISLANCTSVDGFQIEGIQPEDSDRRIVFSYSDGSASDAEYYKLVVSNGIATPRTILLGGFTVENVLVEGNTVDELLSITSIPEWVGKTIYPVIALKGQTIAPTIKLSVVTSSNSAQYEKVEESPVYILADDDVDIINVTASAPEKTGNGSATVQVRFKSGANWGPYMEIEDAGNTKANSAQFRVRYSVSTITGVDSVKVSSISIVYSSANAKVSGTSTNLILVTKHFDKEEGAKGLSFAQCMIRHKKLHDAKIKAYAAFRDEIKTRSMYPLGAGTGEQQTIKLPDSGIAYKSFHVQVNGADYPDVSVNTEKNELTLTVEAGSAITASYEYGWTPEVWQEMAKTAYQSYGAGDEYASAFQIALSDEDTNKTISTIKFELTRPEGDVDNEVLGTATGETQIFVLPHYARADTINCSGLWSYDEDTRILRVQHRQGDQIIISYHWTAESPVVYSVAAGWAKSA